MLIAFFLPWYHISIVSFNGYDIPNTLDKLSNLAGTFKTNSNDNLETFRIIAKCTYFLYLIPVFCIINILANLSDKKLPQLLTRFHFINVVLWLFFTPFLINTSNEENLGLTELLTPRADIGLYLTIVFGILGMFVKDKSLIEIKNNISSSKGNRNSLKFTEENSNLLNQQTQLQSLKEKNIISEELLEKQKQEILENLKTINGEEFKSGISGDIVPKNKHSYFNFKNWVIKNRKIIFYSFAGIIVLSVVGLGLSLWIYEQNKLDGVTLVDNNVYLTHNNEKKKQITFLKKDSLPMINNVNKTVYFTRTIDANPFDFHQYILMEVNLQTLNEATIFTIDSISPRLA
jgi:hypothetical protein